MAAKGSKGSILLEILIVLMALLLISVIIIPNKIWEEEEIVTSNCRQNLNSLYEAERFYFQRNSTYTDSLGKLLTFMQADSGIHTRQMLVSLSNSLTQVLDNILTITSFENISKISLASFEITGDLMGNERYFRKYPEINQVREEIVREMMSLDSSLIFPNFSQTKLFVDSLRDIKESVSDYSLQVATYRAISATDSLSLYYSKLERTELVQNWATEYNKINNFITTIRKTDISKVSTVPDRLKKFIDQINNNVQSLNSANASQDVEALGVEKQSLTELHQKFLSPEFFMLTESYSLTKLDETDSILINLSQDNFDCPDAQATYLFDTSKTRITIECPNLLEIFQQEFKEDIEPIRNIPFYQQVSNISKIIDSTKIILDRNRAELRRYTDVLLKIKELQVELDQMNNVFFYRYTNEVINFIHLLDQEKKLSLLKPAIEDILNPLDTLASRIETGNIVDLEEQMNYFNTKLTELDSSIQATRLPRRVRNKLLPNVEPFQSVFDELSNIKSGFSPDYTAALQEASDELEEDLLEALEGEQEPVYIIFRREHKNHGYIESGEKSWEE
jgi:competence protein ComGC